MDGLINDFLVEMMDGGGFKAFLSFGMFMLERLADLYDFLFVTPIKDSIIAGINSLNQLIPGIATGWGAAVQIFLELFGDWTGLGFAPGFIIMAIGLELAIVVALIKLIFGVFKYVKEILNLV